LQLADTQQEGLRWCMCATSRNKRTTNKFQIAKVIKEGAKVSEPFAIQTNWDYNVRSGCFGRAQGLDCAQ
jgi:hypothetical protein